MHITNNRAGTSEAARRYRQQYERDNWKAFGIAAAIIAVLALGLAYSAVRRAERDSRADMDHAHYEVMAATGGVR